MPITGLDVLSISLNWLRINPPDLNPKTPNPVYAKGNSVIVFGQINGGGGNPWG
ncbi:hypothetical protein KIN_07500 [Litoreibacter roseus]|uniref:Uncharacterized protein n=1 Tax=Litoreibacter roseus TaxID=2601869 RepID=A0A6N6JC03_9RHOB|nr:hypothetical protein KIN_07500 [Litoreibacter roseus]